MNSRVGLEGKENGKTVCFIAFDVSGDRGYTFGWIVKRTCLLKSQSYALFYLVLCVPVVGKDILANWDGH